MKYEIKEYPNLTPPEEAREQLEDLADKMLELATEQLEAALSVSAAAGSVQQLLLLFEDVELVKIRDELVSQGLMAIKTAFGKNAPGGQA